MNKTILPRKNTLYVGSDSSESPLVDAVNSATSGTTVVVVPGSYTIKNSQQLLKNGVNIHFMDGAVVTKVYDILSNETPYGIFDDRLSGAVTCSISGSGEFVYDSGRTNSNLDQGDSNLRGAVYVSNPASSVRFECKKISIKAFYVPSSESDPNAAAIRVDDCSAFDCSVGSIVDPFYGAPQDFGFGPIPSSSVGVVWRWGNASIKCGSIKTNWTGVMCLQKASPTGSAKLDLSSGRVDFYDVTHAVLIANGTTSGWKTNMSFGTMFGDVSCNDIYFISGGGEHTVRASEVYSPTSVVAAASVGATVSGNPTCSIDFQHVSTPEYALIVGSGGVGSPTVFANIDYANQTGASGRIAYFEAGNSIVTGGLWKTASQEGIQHLGGTVRIKNVTINTSATNSANNRCINTSSSGLILDGVTMIAPALADSIFAAAARTVKVYGTSYTNKAKNLNVTIQAGLGSLIADANVS